MKVIYIITEIFYNDNIFYSTIWDYSLYNDTGFATRPVVSLPISTSVTKEGNIWKVQK